MKRALGAADCAVAAAAVPRLQVIVQAVRLGPALHNETISVIEFVMNDLVTTFSIFEKIEFGVQSKRI